jgi:hypothetical protein
MRFIGGAFGIIAGFSQDFTQLLIFNTLMSACLIGSGPISNTDTETPHVPRTHPTRRWETPASVLWAEQRYETSTNNAVPPSGVPSRR